MDISFKIMKKSEKKLLINSKELVQTKSKVNVFL